MSVLTHYIAAVIGAVLGFTVAAILAAGREDR